MHRDCDFLYKLILVGETNVGKSSILLRSVENSFSEDFLPTIGVDFKSYKTTLDDGRTVKL